MPVYDPPEPLLRRAIESVRAQIYEDWELCVADDGSTQAHVRPMLEAYGRLDPPHQGALPRDQRPHLCGLQLGSRALATGEFIALLDHDDEIAPHALYMVATAILQIPASTSATRTKTSSTTLGRRYDPHFKCDWNEGLFYSYNFICTSACIGRRWSETSAAFGKATKGPRTTTSPCGASSAPPRSASCTSLGPLPLARGASLRGALAGREGLRAPRRAARPERPLQAPGPSRRSGGGVAPGLNRARVRCRPVPAPLVSIIVPDPRQPPSPPGLPGERARQDHLPELRDPGRRQPELRSRHPRLFPRADRGPSRPGPALRRAFQLFRDQQFRGARMPWRRSCAC